jgi:Na+-transporting NADH:ubiquinone oxidoreductase subunit A
MAQIKITKGLDIPMDGKPEGNVRPLIPGGEVSPLLTPHLISLNLRSFQDLKFTLLVKLDEVVKLGQPLVEDKSTPGRMFVSPAAGVVKEIRRGFKRSLLDIIIAVDPHEELHQEYPRIRAGDATREALIERMKEGGIFSHIYMRPFNRLADPHKAPRSIFVKALESAPYVPSAEMQVAKYEREFQAGLDALAKLTDGPVHLVYRTGSPCKAFTEARNVQRHTAEGPHPIANVSVHIQALDPIQKPDDIIWTLNAHHVVSLGHLLEHGRHYIERVISIAGPGILPDRTGYFRCREGYPVSPLLAGRIHKGPQRFVSGDPLTGDKVEEDEFLGFEDYVFCVIPENYSREFLHFFRLGLAKYSFSRAYLSGHLNNTDREYFFTTNQHGEERAFIDSTLYDDVQPLAVPTMLLVKAVMAEDYELAQSLGLLEVVGEDFALPTFVDPSKIDMNEIINKGLKRYASEVLA